jgi:hypothetical protein
LFCVRVHDIRNAAHRAGRLALKVGGSTNGPEQHDRADRCSGCEAPAFEAVRNRGVRRRKRYRQDERQNGPGRAGREVAAECAREEDGEADDRHRAGRKPRASRAQGPECDEGRADASEREICEEAASRRSSELGQHEQRDRSERREQGRLRLVDDLVREREHRRHHDRGSRGALQGRHVQAG